MIITPLSTGNLCILPTYVPLYLLLSIHFIFSPSLPSYISLVFFLTSPLHPPISLFCLLHTSSQPLFIPFLFFSFLLFSFLSFPFQHLSDNTLGTFSLLTYFYSCRYIIRSNMSHKLFPFSCS